MRTMRERIMAALRDAKEIDDEDLEARVVRGREGIGTQAYHVAWTAIVRTGRAVRVAPGRYRYATGELTRARPVWA